MVFLFATVLTPTPVDAGNFDDGYIDLYATWTSTSYTGSVAVSIGNEPAWEGRPLVVRYQRPTAEVLPLPTAQILAANSSGGLSLVYDGESEWGRCGTALNPPPQRTQGWMCGLSHVTRGFDGSLFVCACGGQYPANRIFRKPPVGGWQHLAGNGTSGSGGDGGPAVDASISGVNEIAAGPDGSLYISGDHRVRRIGPDGAITTFAGTGLAGDSGDGGPATDATLTWAFGLTVDGDGNVYVGDYGTRRVRVVGTDGVIRAFAGTGTEGFSGDGGPAIDANLDRVLRLAVAPSGEVTISTEGRIRAVGSDGIIKTIVGNGTVGDVGDGGPALDAALASRGLAFDSSGDLFLGQPDRVRRVTWFGSLGGVASVGGSPVGAGVHVAVLESWPSWKHVASTFTAADGSWSVPELKSGSYTVRFWDPWGRYSRVWLGDSASYKAADVVQVFGSALSSADVVLEDRAGLLSGQVTDADTAEPVAGAVVWIIRDGAYVTARVTSSDGAWSIGDLPAGSYLLRFTHPTPWLYKGVWYDNAASVAEATPVVIGQDPVHVTAELGSW